MTTNIDSISKLIGEVRNEFKSIETFVQIDIEKADRFKVYLKKFYDHMKLDENNDLNWSNQTLPELIVDKSLVDNEQIYQQLQLINNGLNVSSEQKTSQTLLSSMTKFFSKCLTNLDDLSFNIDTDKMMKESLRSMDKKVSSENEDFDQQEDEYDGESEDELEEEEDKQDEDENKNDEEEGKLRKSKVNKQKGEEKSVFGIPDGSDSEISDFEVEENDEDDDDDDEEEEGDGLENGHLDNEDDHDDIEDEGEEQGEESDEIDSDEVDEDLVDLYQDLGDEKKALGIGKPTKPFEDIDFDREDFYNDLQAANDPNETSKKSNQKEEVKQSKDLFDLADDDEDENDTAKTNSDKANDKSTYEMRKEKLKETVDKIHDSMLKNVSDKPWQLKGEITAKERPLDSLLQEYVDFDHTTRQAPVMDANSSEALEAMIKQRIKDKAFDDVERKVKPVEMHYEYKKQVILDQEKSKAGLADVYEQEYMKKQAEQESNDKEAKSNPKHDELRKMMQGLFIKLDALSNFHYTPKAPVPDVKVVSNMPTIAIEEVAPVNVSDSITLAPEEIKPRINDLPKSKSEEEKSDKKKKLRAKKLKIKSVKAQKEKKLQLAQSLDPNNSQIAKEMAMNKLKKQAKNMTKNIKILKNDKNSKASTSALRSSSAFFKQLQENVQIGNKVAKKKKLTDGNKKDSKKLKL